MSQGEKIISNEVILSRSVNIFLNVFFSCIVCVFTYMCVCALAQILSAQKIFTLQC